MKSIEKRLQSVEEAANSRVRIETFLDLVKWALRPRGDEAELGPEMEGLFR